MAHNEIINSHKVKCFGITRDNKKVLKEPEDVIVKIFKSGKTKPLCRYFKLVDNMHICNSLQVKSDDFMDFGDCPFYSG